MSVLSSHPNPVLLASWLVSSTQAVSLCTTLHHSTSMVEFRVAHLKGDAFLLSLVVCCRVSYMCHRYRMTMCETLLRHASCCAAVVALRCIVRVGLASRNDAVRLTSSSTRSIQACISCALRAYASICIKNPPPPRNVCPKILT